MAPVQENQQGNWPKPAPSNTVEALVQGNYRRMWDFPPDPDSSSTIVAPVQKYHRRNWAVVTHPASSNTPGPSNAPSSTVESQVQEISRVTGLP